MAGALLACGRQAETREYELTGQILAVQAERGEVLIRHDDIKGFMPGMTMPFKVRDESLLAGKAPGDLVRATLVVADTTAHLSSLTTVGHAPIDVPPPPPAPAVLEAGALVADAPLVDQDGAPFTIASLHGHRAALTFTYTRCPLPDFCPLIDRHFRTVQQQILERADMRDVRLVTVTLDPAYDTPPVLRDHARQLKADTAGWSFVTGPPEDVARFGRQFGLFVEQNPDDPADITHNLRTVVVDTNGRLVKIIAGNAWTPAELVADLAAIAPPAN